ncbi:MAG: histidine kinase [Pseudomonadota bacterium]|nr:histidine kinase [Pseudomonadota bacterium]
MSTSELSTADPARAVGLDANDAASLIAWLDQRHQQQHDALAAQLHDELGSALTALSMRLALIARQTGDDAKLTAQWNKAQVQLAEISQTARQVQRQLRPAALDALGLPAALAELAQRFSEEHQCAFDNDIDMTLTALPLQGAQTVFRIAQEAHTNVGRHAAVTTLRVALTRQPAAHDTQHVMLGITDNGNGFDAARHDWRASHGVRLMQARAASIGAQLDIHSTLGQGCQVILHWQVAL